MTVPRQRIGVNLVAFDELERVFMLRHVFHPFTPWGLPGGWLGRNESPAKGVLRELREETGLTAVLGPVIQVNHEASPRHVGIAYLGRIQPGAMRLNSEIIEAGWFSMTELPSPLLPLVQQAIETGVLLNRWWRETAVVATHPTYLNAEKE